MSKPGACNLCGSEASQKCSGCLGVSYCSKEHQRLDWRVHKSGCLPFEVTETKELGRCLRAKRELRHGEIVLREKPLVSGPPQMTGPVCLGCHNLLAGPGSGSPVLACGRCGWPVCSLDCASSPVHRPECDWALEKRKDKVKISNFSCPHPTYGCLLPLRLAHAKLTDPKLWAKISSLEDHGEQRRRDGKWEQERFAVAQPLRRFYKLGSEVTEEEILDIVGIIQINGHEVPLSEPPYVSIYWRCSFLEHSCHPNCSKSFSDSGEVVVRAQRRIRRGEHLSISYTDPLWGTPTRLNHLLETKYFQCRCPRCLDVTEMGTYFSALKCTKDDCGGKVLPETFLVASSPWRCNTCGNSETPESISGKLGEEAVRLSRVNKTSPSSCKEYLDSETLLTENHYHRVELKLGLAQLIGQSAGGLAVVSDDWLQVKESLCRELIHFSSILFPAECRIRGILHFELHAALAERARREAVRGGGADSVPAQLLETRTHLENAIQELKHEPNCLPEGKICRQAKENLQDLDKLLKSMNVSIMGGL